MGPRCVWCRWYFHNKKLISQQLIESIVAALDGQLKHEDTNLASSTLIHDPTQKENLGIIVQYKVKVSILHMCFLMWMYFMSFFLGKVVPGTSGGRAGSWVALHSDASKG